MDANQKIKKLEVLLDVHTKEGVAALAKVVGQADLVSRALKDMGKSADAAAGQSTKLSRDFVWGVEELADKTDTFNLSVKGVNFQVKQWGETNMGSIAIMDDFGRVIDGTAIDLTNEAEAAKRATKIAEDFKNKHLSISEMLAKKLNPSLTKTEKGLDIVASRYRTVGAAITGAVAGAFKFGKEKGDAAIDTFAKLEYEFTKMGASTGTSMGLVQKSIMGSMQASQISAEEAGAAFSDLWDVQGFNEASKNLTYMTQMQKIYGVEVKATAEAQDEYHALLGGTEEQFRGLQGTAIKAQKAMRLPKNFTKEVMAAIPQMNQLAMQVGGNGAQVKNMTERMMGFAAVMKKSVGASVQSAIKVFGELESKTVGFQSQFERFRLGLTDQLPEQELLQLSKGFKSAGDAYKFMMADQGTKIEMLKQTTAGLNGNAESAKRLYYSLYDTYGPEATNMMLQSATKTDKATAKLFKGLEGGTEKDALGGLTEGMKKLGGTVEGHKIAIELETIKQQFNAGAIAAPAYKVQLEKTFNVIQKFGDWASTSTLGKWLLQLNGTLKGIGENPIWGFIASMGIGSLIGGGLKVVGETLMKMALSGQSFGMALKGALGWTKGLGGGFKMLGGAAAKFAAILGVIETAIRLIMNMFSVFSDKSTSIGEKIQAIPLAILKTTTQVANSMTFGLLNKFTGINKIWESGWKSLTLRVKSMWMETLGALLGQMEKWFKHIPGFTKILAGWRTGLEDAGGKAYVESLKTNKAVNAQAPSSSTTEAATSSASTPTVTAPSAETPAVRKVDLGKIKGEAERQMLTQLEQASQFLSSIAGTIQSAVVGEDNKIIIQVDDTQFRNVFRAMMEKDYHLAKA